AGPAPGRVAPGRGNAVRRVRLAHPVPFGSGIRPGPRRGPVRPAGAAGGRPAGPGVEPPPLTPTNFCPRYNDGRPPTHRGLLAGTPGALAGRSTPTPREVPHETLSRPGGRPAPAGVARRPHGPRR